MSKINAEKSLYGLINALKHADPEVRLKAAEMLGQLKDEVASNALIEGLHDDCWSVRRNAAWALGEIGATRAIPYLVSSFSKTWEGIDAYCAEALVKIGRPAVMPLLQVIEGPDLNTRYWSIEALGEIGDTRAVEPLITLLTDKDVIVRYSAAKALGAIGDSRAFNSLAQLLHDPSAMVKQQAKKSISRVLPSETPQKSVSEAERVTKLIVIIKNEDGSLKEVTFDV
jgi:HEAT repeat protein